MKYYALGSENCMIVTVMPSLSFCESQRYLAHTLCKILCLFKTLIFIHGVWVLFRGID